MVVAADVLVLDTGTKLQAQSLDGIWRTGHVQAVSKKKGVLVHFMGCVASDEWIAVERLRSKPLRKVKAKSKRRKSKLASSNIEVGLKHLCLALAESAKLDDQSNRQTQQSTNLDDEPVYTPAQNLSAIDEGKVSITRAWINADTVSALRADARALYEAGAFITAQVHTPGGSVTPLMDATRMSDSRRRSCDTCGLFDHALAADGVGNLEARDDLFDRIAALRDELREQLGRPISEGMELQYLRYPASGGFYERHRDRDKCDDACHHRRSVSMVLYLNEEGWDAQRDGGALRAWIPKGAQGLSELDVDPLGGTLGLFDSGTVDHAAMPTHRERWVLVGWFLHDENDKQHCAGRRTKRRKRKHVKSCAGEDANMLPAENSPKGKHQRRGRKSRKCLEKLARETARNVPVQTSRKCKRRK